jgi:hypothetical protein
LPLLLFRILDEFIIRNRLIFDEQRGLVRECKTPQKSDAELKKYLIKKKAVVEESDTELSVEEIKPPSKKATSAKRPKALVGRKRKLPVRLDASSSSSDSDEEVVIEKPPPRPKRITGTAASIVCTTTDVFYSAVTVASAAAVAPVVAIASDICVSNPVRRVSVTDVASGASVNDTACGVSVPKAASSVYDAARSAVPVTDAAAMFQPDTVSNAPANISTCILPQNSALQHLKMHGTAFESAKMESLNSFQATTAYAGVPGATYADSMSDLICDSIFYKMELAQQKMQIEELKRREEERRVSDYMKAVQAEGKATFRLHMRQMFGGNSML